MILLFCLIISRKVHFEKIQFSFNLIGVIFSPIPSTKAGWFNKQKGTSAPSDLAKANVDRDDKYEADTYVVKDGYFDESSLRSAPYWEVRIDGITELTERIKAE